MSLSTRLAGDPLTVEMLLREIEDLHDRIELNSHWDTVELIEIRRRQPHRQRNAYRLAGGGTGSRGRSANYARSNRSRGSQVRCRASIHRHHAVD